MRPLKVLLIEDNADDAALVSRALSQAGFDVAATRVESADDLRGALSGSIWDLAIADYTIPGFSGTKALAMIREQGLDLPFIFVSGTIGEDIAVAAMKTGAQDYIMKGNLARLAPAVERELREAAVRRERTRANERVAYLAYHDPLTELPNRALLHDRLQQAILTSKRENKAISLLVLDLDGFKAVNDALGHHAGDRVLQQLAGRLRAVLRESDTVARLGGDEFAMLLPLTDLQGAELAARKVLGALEQAFIVDSKPLIVHGSIGIAGFPTHASNGQELMQRADGAMYVAKTTKCGYSMYSADRDVKTDQQLGQVTALRLGIDDEQFMLDYQPVVDLQSGHVIGVEALLRWDHPQQGRLLPEAFIPLAEHTGLITPLTSFAIDRAMSEWSPASAKATARQAAKASARQAGERSLTIAVNLSPRSLHDASFPSKVYEMLQQRDADPSSLCLEITENLIMSDPERSTQTLTELHAMGIRLIVDDFGTGYSSLSYLRRLPVDGLKIDQSFVIGLASGEDDALVRSIIDLAHNLRLSVIAEGVETQEVQDRLLAMGCDAGQGHHICRPAPAGEIAAWIAQRGV